MRQGEVITASQRNVVLFLGGLLLFAAGFAPLALIRVHTPTETGTATTIDHILIQYDVTRRVATPLDAPLALLLHGFSGNRVMMRLIAVALADAGFISVSVDLRGHGSSEGTMGELDDFIEDLYAVLRSLQAHGIGDPTRLVLLGHSMGGGVVLQPRPQGPAAVATIGVAPVASPEWVTTTTPPNLLLILSTADAVINATVVRETFEKAVNGSREVNEVHVLHGTARKLTVLDGGDHLNLLYHEAVIGEIVAWSTQYVFDEARPLTSAPHQTHLATYVALAGGTAVILSILSALWREERAPTHPGKARGEDDRRAVLTMGVTAIVGAGVGGSLLATGTTLVLTRVTPFIVANLMTALFVGNAVILGSLARAGLRRGHQGVSYWRFVAASLRRPTVVVEVGLGLFGAAAFTGLLGLTVGSTLTATGSTASLRLTALPLYIGLFGVVFTLYESFFRGWMRPRLGASGRRWLYAILYQWIVLLATFILEVVLLTTILAFFMPYIHAAFFLLGLPLVAMALGVATVSAEVLYARTGGWIPHILISAVTLATLTLVFSPTLPL